jgi:hypothetical protein
VIPVTGLEDVDRRQILSLPGLELRSLNRPAPNQSLFRALCVAQAHEVGWPCYNSDSVIRGKNIWGQLFAGGGKFDCTR